MSLYRFALLWLVGTNLLAIVLTVSDKVRAKKGKWRVPEDTLLFVALLGGAVGEYITMRLIRHKTRHKKFMITPCRYSFCCKQRWPWCWKPNFIFIDGKNGAKRLRFFVFLC